jgi:hypothetical protein
MKSEATNETPANASSVRGTVDEMYEGRGSTSPKHDSERPFHSGREDLYVERQNAG